MPRSSSDGTGSCGPSRSSAAPAIAGRRCSDPWCSGVRNDHAVGSRDQRRQSSWVRRRSFRRVSRHDAGHFLRTTSTSAVLSEAVPGLSPSQQRRLSSAFDDLASGAENIVRVGLALSAVPSRAATQAPRPCRRAPVRVRFYDDRVRDARRGSRLAGAGTSRRPRTGPGEQNGQWATAAINGGHQRRGGSWCPVATGASEGMIARFVPSSITAPSCHSMPPSCARRAAHGPPVLAAVEC